MISLRHKVVRNVVWWWTFPFENVDAHGRTYEKSR